MITLEDRKRRLTRAFPADQADVLAEVITEAYDELVKTGDFRELKELVGHLGRGLDDLRGTVADLAEAQKRTEYGLGELRGTVADLAEAQKRTEHGLGELRGAVADLAEAQKRTEHGLDDLRGVVRELAQAQAETSNEVRKLAIGLGATRRDVGGLSQSIGYAMENEAYRMLPPLLEERYGITLTRRLLRTHVGEQEINLFGEGTRGGQPVLVVGEVKVRLDARWRKSDPTVFEDLEERVEAVRQAYPGREIVPIIVTHYARPAFVEEAQKRGVAVIQSFEW